MPVHNGSDRQLSFVIPAWIQATDEETNLFRNSNCILILKSTQTPHSYQFACIANVCLLFNMRECELSLQKRLAATYAIIFLYQYFVFNDNFYFQMLKVSFSYFTLLNQVGGN